MFIITRVSVRHQLLLHTVSDFIITHTHTYIPTFGVKSCSSSVQFTPGRGETFRKKIRVPGKPHVTFVDFSSDSAVVSPVSQLQSDWTGPSAPTILMTTAPPAGPMRDSICGVCPGTVVLSVWSADQRRLHPDFQSIYCFTREEKFMIVWDTQYDPSIHKHQPMFWNSGVQRVVLGPVEVKHNLTTNTMYPKVKLQIITSWHLLSSYTLPYRFIFEYFYFFFSISYLLN